MHLLGMMFEIWDVGGVKVLLSTDPSQHTSLSKSICFTIALVSLHASGFGCVDRSDSHRTPDTVIYLLVMIFEIWGVDGVKVLLSTDLSQHTSLFRSICFIITLVPLYAFGFNCVDRSDGHRAPDTLTLLCICWT